MTTISATTHTFRSHVDGTISATVEIDPISRAAFLELMSNPGTAIAIVGITQATAVVVMQEAMIEADKPTGGRLSQWAAIRCVDPLFLDWVATKYGEGEDSKNEAHAKQLIYYICGIKSRVELDHDVEAAAKFHEFIRIPFAAWLKI